MWRGQQRMNNETPPHRNAHPSHSPRRPPHPPRFSQRQKISTSPPPISPSLPSSRPPIRSRDFIPHKMEGVQSKARTKSHTDGFSYTLRPRGGIAPSYNFAQFEADLQFALGHSRQSPDPIGRHIFHRRRRFDIRYDFRVERRGQRDGRRG